MRTLDRSMTYNEALANWRRYSVGMIGYPMPFWFWWFTEESPDSGTFEQWRLTKSTG